MRNYKQPGDVLTLTAPSGGVQSGEGYTIGELFVVAAADADAGEEFEGQRTGVFELNKAGDSISEGGTLYWDDGEKELTTSASGNRKVGAAVEDKDAADEKVEVLLDGVPRTDEA